MAHNPEPVCMYTCQIVRRTVAKQGNLRCCQEGTNGSQLRAREGNNFDIPSLLERDPRDCALHKLWGPFLPLSLAAPPASETSPSQQPSTSLKSFRIHLLFSINVQGSCCSIDLYKSCDWCSRHHMCMAFERRPAPALDRRSRSAAEIVEIVLDSVLLLSLVHCQVSFFAISFDI